MNKIEIYKGIPTSIKFNGAFIAGVEGHQQSNPIEEESSTSISSIYVVIPKQLEKQVVEWYHNALCHPGETRTELSISQHFYWKNLRKTVHEICTKCKTCQFLKRNKKQYGRLPPKEAETIPWDTLCVDLISKYQFTPKGGEKKFQILLKGKFVFFIMQFP